MKISLIYLDILQNPYSIDRTFLLDGRNSCFVPESPRSRSRPEYQRQYLELGEGHIRLFLFQWSINSLFIIYYIWSTTNIFICRLTRSCYITSLIPIENSMAFFHMLYEFIYFLFSLVYHSHKFPFQLYRSCPPFESSSLSFTLKQFQNI